MRQLRRARRRPHRLVLGARLVRQYAQSG
jgi:hypothetical protein